MYKEIEELEKSLNRNRNPAMEGDKVEVDGTGTKVDMGTQIPVDGYLKSGSYQFDQPEVKQIMPVPKNSQPDPAVTKVPASQYSRESVVGAVDPDYSGYDDLLKRLEGLKPRDTSTQDLINMGISTGIGILGGRAGVGAKVAGEYGLDRYNKAEKRTDSIEDMILKLQADRAAKMAAGKKGTKVKTGGSTNFRGQTRVGTDGGLYWMTNVDENGKYVPDEGDQRYTPINAKMVTTTKYDGSKVTRPMSGNSLGLAPEGMLAPKQSIIKDAEDNANTFNPYSGQVAPIGSDNNAKNFNSTSLGLSKSDDKRYAELENKVSSYSKSFHSSNLQARSGLTALANNDNASALMALKEGLRAAEGGKVSDADFTIMKSGLGPSFEARINSWLGKVTDGQGLSDQERKELRNMLTHIKNSSERGYESTLNNHNSMANKFLSSYPEDVRGKLQFRNSWGSYDVKNQKKEAEQTIRERGTYVHKNPEFKKDSSGKVWEGYLDENGKFIVTDEARK